MMRKVLLVLAAVLCLCAGCACAAAEGRTYTNPETGYRAVMEDDIDLLTEPEEAEIMEALQQRKSERHYTDGSLTEAQLSKILWAANGVNRPEGAGQSGAKRVNPAALGVYSVDVYAVTPDGIYLYEPDGHKLRLTRCLLIF